MKQLYSQRNYGTRKENVMALSQDLINQFVKLTDKEEKPEDTSEEHKACAVGGGTAKKKSSNESKPKESQDTNQDNAGKSGFVTINMDADIDF